MKHKFDLDKIDAIIKDEEINGCSVCEDCKTTYTNYEVEKGLVTPCPSCYKCYTDKCTPYSCGCDEEEE